jgi:hypothetical protein
LAIRALLPPIEGELLPESETRLFGRLSGRPITFSWDKRDKVASLTMQFGGETFYYEKISDQPPKAPEPYNTTLVNAPAIQSALRSVRAGAVGGGCVPRFEGWLPWWFRLVEPLIKPAVRLAHFLPSVACLFCTRSAFQTAGGFPSRMRA